MRSWIKLLVWPLGSGAMLIKMKAAIRRNYGPPNALKIETVEKPVPKADEVLIRVHATTVNRTDVAILTGKPYIMRLFTGLMKPSSPTPGTDFAGIVEELGSNVNSFKVGDHVWGFHDEGLSSQAEYMTFSENKAILKMPEGLSFEQAAASLEGVHYAINFLNKVEIKPGQKILINGATGAIGSALLQMLTFYKTSVTAVCNTKNIDLIKSLGAVKIYDYEREDFTKDKEKYTYVVDAVGKSTFRKCKHLLEPGGAYISSELGPGAQNAFLALITPLISKKKVIFPFPNNKKGSILFIKDLIEQGKFTAVIDRTLPKEQIAEAYAFVASGQKTGNVVIKWAE